MSEQIKPVAWLYLDFAGFLQATTNEVLAADYNSKGITIIPLFAGESFPVDALKAAVEVLKAKEFWMAINKRPDDPQLTEHIASLQQMIKAATNA